MGNTNDRPETDLTLQVFRSYQLTREEIALSEFINRIRTGMYESVVAVVRRLAARGDLERANAAKGTMPSVCVSALFGGRRTAECVTRYLPLLPLDFDGLPSLAEAERLRTRAMALPFTLAAFVTAKGRGVKVICRTPGNPLALTGEALKEMHRALYDRLADLYERRLGCKADRSGSDLTRTVLASYDPGALVRQPMDCSPLPPEAFEAATRAESGAGGTLTPPDGENPAEGTEGASQGTPSAPAGEKRKAKRRTVRPSAGRKPRPQAALDACIAEMERQGEVYAEGNRNNYLYRLARKLNACGVDEAGAEELLAARFAHDGRETRALVHSAYANHRDEHATRIPAPRRISRSEAVGEAEAWLREHYRLRYNVITRRLEIDLEGGGDYEPMDDYRENSIFRDLCHQEIGVTKKNLEYLLRSDFTPHFNPFLAYLEALPEWDGETDHIDRLAATVRVAGSDDDNAEWRADFKRWMVAMVASWVLPKAVNQVALILVGPQGVYKTTWITSLLPPELGSYLYSGPFNPQDKDHILNLSRCALINCEEIDALSGERLNRFKSILTQSSTNERAAYGRNTEFCVRCASFAGSTNQTELIADPTGLRRWLIVQVEAIESPFDRPFAYAGIYAQAYALVRQGFRWWSDTADIRRMNRRNERFEMKSVEEELITTWYRPPREGEPYRLLTSADVLQRLSGMVRVPLSKNNIGRILRRLGYRSHTVKGVRNYEVVELSLQEVNEIRNS